ncbi:rna binding protein [Pelomyxa schiedti]|nr:rna binding protein [Pelomyxa schiedti]
MLQSHTRLLATQRGILPQVRPGAIWGPDGPVLVNTHTKSVKSVNSRANVYKLTLNGRLPQLFSTQAADSGATGNATQPPTESPDQNAAATATPFAMMDPQQQAYLYSYYQSYGYYDPSQYAAMMAAQQPATQTPNVTTATADATSVTPAQTTETPANSTTPASGTAQTQFTPSATPSALPFTTPYAPYGQYPMMPGLPMMGAGAMNPMAGMMMMGGMANPYMRALAAAAASGQQPTKSLWVGNLHPETTEEEIRIAFSGFGPVESIKVLNPKNCAFIKYEDVNSAIQAYGAMLGRSIHGQQIKVGWGKAEPATEEKGPPCRNLWIGNIHPDTTEDDIAALFRQFGAIERVRVIPHKNCAFVNFIHLDACVAAKARMQGKPLKGQPMKLNYGKETTSNFPPMPSQFLKAEELPPPRVPAPTGPEKILVDKLAEFVVKNGLAFEQMMTTKQQENPSPNTSCLTPSDPNHGYYRWRVFEMTMEKNTSELPPLPPLPTAPSAATTTTPPWVTNANAAQTTQQAETQPAVLSDSETSELKALILQSPSQTMQEAKDWITGHIKQIPSISQVLLACIVSATGFDKRYSIMGLINDLLRQGRSNRKVDETTDDISAALKPLLSTVVRLSYLGETQVNQDKLFKLLDQWSDDKVYDPTFIKQLQASAIAAVKLQQIIPVQAIETANRIALGALTEPSKLPTSTTQPLQLNQHQCNRINLNHPAILSQV